MTGWGENPDAAAGAPAAAAVSSGDGHAGLEPALAVDAAGFPVAYADVRLSRPERPCPVVFLPSGGADSTPEADWAALASLLSGGASLRLRLSMRALPLALAHLEQAGAGPGMPAVLVYRLESPFFQTAQAGLHDMAQLVRRLRPASPVDVLVGRHVAPVPPAPGRELVGRTIAVACEASVPCKLAGLLAAAGARVFEQPVVKGGADEGAAAEVVASLAAGDAGAFSCEVLAAGLEDGALDAVVLPDAQLAGAFFRLLGARAQALLASTRVVACGPIAGSVVEQHGLAPALQTDSYVPSRVAEAVRALDFTPSAT